MLFLSYIGTHRTLIASLVRRDIVGRYAGSYAGLLWALLLPLLNVAVYTVVFSVIMKATTVGKYQHIPFPVWLMAGLLPWFMFSEAVSVSSRSVTGNMNMVKKTLFDKRVLPLASVLSCLVGHCISMVILLALMLAFRITPTWTIVFVPLISFLLTVFTLAWAYLLSALSVFIRDIDHAIAPLLQIFFFATPIVYPVEFIPEGFKAIALLNPMHHMIEIYRQVLFLGVPPEPTSILGLAAVAFTLLACADYLFRSLAPEFCDAL